MSFGRNATVVNTFVGPLQIPSTPAKNKQFRIKAGTRAWAVAEELKWKKEAQFEGKPTTPENEQQTIEAAIQRFLDSKRVQGIDAQVVKKYERELERLRAFFPKSRSCSFQRFALSTWMSFVGHGRACTHPPPPGNKSRPACADSCAIVLTPDGLTAFPGYLPSMQTNRPPFPFLRKITSSSWTPFLECLRTAKQKECGPWCN